MRFHLTYEGSLPSSKRDTENDQRDPRALQKHKIRRQVHPQMKRLWETTKFLSEAQIYLDKELRLGRLPDGQAYWSGESKQGPMAEVLANENEKFGYRFVPLVARDIALKCHLDILFLRPDEPGHVLRSGDIDNRLKTLFDGLRLPQSEAEMAGIPGPTDDEDPFYCLLEDDSLISSISVETDMLLSKEAKEDASYVRLLIAVEIKPYHVTMNNLSFA